MSKNASGSMSCGVPVSIHETAFTTKPTPAQMKSVTMFHRQHVENPEQYLNLMLRGHTTTNGIFHGQDAFDGELNPVWRKSDNWIGTHAILLDFDSKDSRTTVKTFLKTARKLNAVPNFIYATRSNTKKVLEDVERFRAVYLFDTLIDKLLFKIMAAMFNEMFGEKKIDQASFSLSQPLFGTYRDAPCKVFNNSFLSLDDFFLNFDVHMAQQLPMFEIDVETKYFKDGLIDSDDQTELDSLGKKVKLKIPNRFAVEISDEDESCRKMARYGHIYSILWDCPKLSIFLHDLKLNFLIDQVNSSPSHIVDSVAKDVDSEIPRGIDKNTRFSRLNKQQYPLLEMFDNSEYLSHRQKICLVSNFCDVSGFEKWFLHKLQTEYYPKYPKADRTIRERVAKWKEQFKYWRKRHRGFSCKYGECPCGSTSGATMKENHGGEVSRIHFPADTEFKSVEERSTELTELLDGIMATIQDGEIHLVDAPMGLGKTEYFMRRELPERCVYAVPYHRLLEEVVERYQHEAFHYAPRPKFNDEALESMITRLEEYQHGGIRETVRREIIVPLESRGDILTNDQAEDLANAKSYHRQLTSVRDQSRVLCTHTKSLSLFPYFDTFIYDEDPIKHLLADSITISRQSVKDLAKKLPEELREWIETFQFAPTSMAKPVPRLSELQLKSLFRFAKQHPNLVRLPLSDMAKAAFVIESQNSDSLIFAKRFESIPARAKVIILSATLPVELYQRMYGDRVRVHRIGRANAMGKTIQHFERSYSKTSIRNKCLSDEEWFARCTGPGSLDTSLRVGSAVFRMRFFRHGRSIIR